MSITDERLTEIRARLAAATDGPWFVDGPALPGPGDSLVIYPKQGGTIAYVQPSWDDAEFIAHAREDVPALLAEIDRLRGKLADARVNITYSMVDRAAREIYHQLSGEYGDFCTPSMDQAWIVLTAALNGR